MSREELKGMKVKELATICKDKGIKHYNGKSMFSKLELIEVILLYQAQEAAIELNETESEKPMEVQPPTNRVVVKEKKTTIVEVVIDREKKAKYLSEVNVGTLIAFVEPNGRVNTAAVKNASFKREQLKLETQYGKEFIVSFDDVIWIKTVRWPLFVFKLLKEKSYVKCVNR